MLSLACFESCVLNLIGFHFIEVFAEYLLGTVLGLGDDTAVNQTDKPLPHGTFILVENDRGQTISRNK